MQTKKSIYNSFFFRTKIVISSQRREDQQHVTCKPALELTFNYFSSLSKPGLKAAIRAGTPLVNRASFFSNGQVEERTICVLNEVPTRYN